MVDYSVLHVIAWTLPCKTNGALNHFVVRINGSSTIDSTTYFNTTNVEVNLDESYYEFNYTSTNAAYAYTVYVALVLASGQEGYTSEVEFSTPEGCKCFYKKYVFLVMIK